MIKACFKLLKMLQKNYDSCNLDKKPVPRRIVPLARATSFNDNVAMHLHHLNEFLWYLHFID